MTADTDMRGGAAVLFMVALVAVPIGFLASLGLILYVIVSSPNQWTMGFQIGLPIVDLLFWLVIGIAAWLIGMRLDEPDGYDAGMFLGFGIAAAAVVPIIVGASLWGFWPLQAQYHQYRPVHGTVANISNRFVGGDHSTSQKFVVTLTSGSQQYGISDTRAALLKPGDPVSLRCIRVYEYGSNDAGYDCKWGQS